MDCNIQKQSRFSRAMANEEKMGAYFTDVSMCERMRNLFEFDDNKEYSILEPSIGNAKAIGAVLGEPRSNIKVFGIELNTNTYHELQKNPHCDYSLNADFLNDVYITNSIFSMVWMNPPYGLNENGCRYETLFLEKATSYLKSGGIMCAVIPSYIFQSEKWCRTYLARYEHLAHFRFDEGVYEQFKQVVVVGKKKQSLGLEVSTLEHFMEAVSEVELYPYLPEGDYENKIIVPPSPADGVSDFTTRVFNPEEAYSKMKKTSQLFTSKKVCSKVEMKEYSAVELGNPILPLSPSMCYLISTIGGGSGLCGEEGAKHLQRGTAEVKRIEEIDYDPETDKNIIREVSKTVLSLKIVQNDGTITTFS